MKKVFLLYCLGILVLFAQPFFSTILSIAPAKAIQGGYPFYLHGNLMWFEAKDVALEGNVLWYMGEKHPTQTLWLISSGVNKGKWIHPRALVALGITSGIAFGTQEIDALPFLTLQITGQFFLKKWFHYFFRLWFLQSDSMQQVGVTTGLGFYLSKKA